MSKKFLKFALALGMLVGGMSLSAKDVSAAGYCYYDYICCDRNCTGIRRCYPFDNRCVCNDVCEPAINPIGGI